MHVTCVHMDVKATLDAIPLELYFSSNVSQWDLELSKEARPFGRQALGILSVYPTNTGITRALQVFSQVQSIRLKALLMHT